MVDDTIRLSRVRKEQWYLQRWMVGLLRHLQDVMSTVVGFIATPSGIAGESGWMQCVPKKAKN